MPRNVVTKHNYQRCDEFLKSFPDIEAIALKLKQPVRKTSYMAGTVFLEGEKFNFKIIGDEDLEFQRRS
jgi:hypothetical protein